MCAVAVEIRFRLGEYYIAITHHNAHPAVFLFGRWKQNAEIEPVAFFVPLQAISETLPEPVRFGWRHLLFSLAATSPAPKENESLLGVENLSLRFGEFGNPRLHFFLLAMAITTAGACFSIPFGDSSLA